MVDHVQEMTMKKSCGYGEYMNLLFLLNHWLNPIADYREQSPDHP